MMIRDHLGRELELNGAPQRIVSLCPSQTETLFELGAGSRLVGRTKFCIHPQPEIERVPEIGGTKKVRMDDIRALKPDFILAEMEEQTPELVRELQAEFPVFVTRVEHIHDALVMIKDLGVLLSGEFVHLSTSDAPELPPPPEAIELLAGIHLASEIDGLLNGIAPLETPKTCAYLIWEKPIMAVGANTYINSVLAYLGLVNVALSDTSRYPKLTDAQLQAMQPDLLLLSSEPFPYKDAHLARYQQLLPNSDVRLVDGEMFSWYGARMKTAAAYLSQFIRSL
ncbi:MAG: helical backbone metal receptor [Bacteroidota bacterium]